MMPDNMVFGVIVDWADSVGIFIVSWKMMCTLCDKRNGNIIDYSTSIYEKREDAREQTVKKLNEIYNKL